jgi:hypothetical protein
MLATYGAADRGRRNKDWRAAGISADQAIIPDAEVINARSGRWCAIRGSPSAVSAFARNVIGCGIIPVPQAKDAAGQLDVELNKTLMLEFWTWASDKNACDVEKDQTFWQMQTLAEIERATVGEAFWVLGVRAGLLPNGRSTAAPGRAEDPGVRAGAARRDDPELHRPGTARSRGARRARARRVGRGGRLPRLRAQPNDYAWRQSLQSCASPPSACSTTTARSGCGRSAASPTWRRCSRTCATSPATRRRTCGGRSWRRASAGP